jgi:hypothetical protein
MQSINTQTLTQSPTVITFPVTEKSISTKQRVPVFCALLHEAKVSKKQKIII